MKTIRASEIGTYHYCNAPGGISKIALYQKILMISQPAQCYMMGLGKLFSQVGVYER